MNTDSQQHDNAPAWAHALRDTHRPHRLMKTVAGVLWETISYPWAERGRVLVNVRVPGDPTTLITVDALAMDPEGRDCYCASAGEFYFRDTPADVERRAADVARLTVALSTAPPTPPPTTRGSLVYKARARKGIEHTAAGVIYVHHFGTGFQELVFDDHASAARFADANHLTLTAGR